MTDYGPMDMDAAGPAVPNMAEPKIFQLRKLEIPTNGSDESLLDSLPGSATTTSRDSSSYRSSSPESEEEAGTGSPCSFALHPGMPLTPIPKPMSFLDLPVEIRLRIYVNVFHNTPMPRKGVAAWYPTPTPGLFITTLCRASISLPPDEKTPGEDPDNELHRQLLMSHGTQPKDLSHWKTQGLLDPYRPYHCIPSALLRTCRTVNNEAAVIAWNMNEFCFINWLSGGVAGGNSFLRAREPWQLERLRWMRLEAYVEELTAPSQRRKAMGGDVSEDRKGSAGGYFGVWSSQKSVDTWVELCGRLTGVQGLRLMACKRAGGDNDLLLWNKMTAYTDPKDSGALPAQNCIPDAAEGGDEEWKGPEWILALRKMPSLREVEIQIEFDSWDVHACIRFCSHVERLVNYGRGHTVTVKAVESIRKRKEALLRLQHAQTQQQPA